ncbi:MAG: muts2 family protein [Chloroflexi bacterium]|nr:muts2 family protein [Chloroflexota bacterium]
MPMLPRHLTTLEFDKIVRRLAAETTFSASQILAESLTPSTDLAEIRRAQDGTEEARRLLEVRPGTGVRGAIDITPHIRRAAVGAPLRPTELVEVASLVASGRSIRALITRQEVHAPTLSRIARGIPDLDDLEDGIHLTIDDEGMVLDRASDHLRAIRADMRTAYDRLMRRLNELIASQSMREALQEPIVTMRAGRYVVPVKSDFKGRVRGIVHDQSSSGATLFIEPLVIVELTNKWRQYGIEEEHEIERILLELSGLVGVAQYGLIDTVAALARIDLAFAMGRLALAMNATRPAMRPFDQLGGGPEVRLISARHPLLHGEVVPISMELGQRFDLLLITGPNTGGKTVALKTVGLLALMAQAGLQVPAAEGSSFAMFSGVYADIGDEQSIEQSLSTFSSHITRIVEVLRVADRESLVLLDEIGAGTDPQEGSALSRSILEHLVASRILTIATTHYSELKSFAYASPRVENASVEFDTETLRPTYRLTVGVPGRSNALAIAERLGVPHSIVASARSTIRPTERRADELLEDIHEHLERARDDRSEAARLKLEAERSAQQLRSRLTEVDRERDAILNEVAEERAGLVAELRAEADVLRRELRGLRADRARLSEIEGRIGGIGSARSHLPDETPRETPTQTFLVGERVSVPSLGSTGVIRAVASAGETAEVDVGGMRVKVRVSDLAPIEGGRDPSPREQAVASGYLEPSSSLPRRITNDGWSPIESQLDLRGLRPEDARQRLDQYLNDAFMEGLNTVRVVHGRGTGAVRAAVRELLVDHPLVRSHETAEQREGGEGATVVRLAS